MLKFFFFFLISLVFSQNITELPQEVLDNYVYYTDLENFEKVCNFEEQLDTYKESEVKSKIMLKLESEECFPDAKTLEKLLKYGYLELIEKLVIEHYLPNKIDPTSIIYSYIGENETNVKALNNLVGQLDSNKKVKITFSFENFDEKVRFFIAIPDASYSPEYHSVLCYKDMLKFNFILKFKNNLIRVQQTRKFFDLTVGDCDYSYNSFTGIFDVTVEKKNKYRVWDSLFK